jgi:hypothetical protein
MKSARPPARWRIFQRYRIELSGQRCAAQRLRPHPEEPRSGVSKDGCVHLRCHPSRRAQERAPQDEEKSDLHVQPLLQKYFHSLLTQITCLSFAIPAHTEGRFAIVKDVGHGMRWTQAAHLTRALPCGRRSRVVLTPRRWRQVRGFNLRATVARKPGHRGEREISC